MAGESGDCESDTGDVVSYYEDIDRKIESIVRGVLRDSPMIHKRRCAIAGGVRESHELEGGCNHSNWDEVRRWCRDCGVTQEEKVFRRPEM